MSTIGGFSYVELNKDSGTGTIAQDGQAVRVFQVAWTDFVAFTKALVGGWTQVNPTTLTFAAADKHPDWPFYCTTTTYDHTGTPSSSGGVSSWEFAIITATYKSLQYDITPSPQDIFSQDIDISLDAEVIPPDALETSDDGTAANKTTTKLVPNIVYTMTYFALPTLNLATIFNFLGQVNSTAFQGANPAQMLFLGATASRTTTTGAIPNWRVAYKFVFRPVEWTKVFVSAKGDFVTVKQKVGGDELYTSSDFNQLLPGP